MLFIFSFQFFPLFVFYFLPLEKFFPITCFHVTALLRYPFFEKMASKIWQFSMDRRLNQVFVTLISVKTTRKKNEKEGKRAKSKKIVIPAFFGQCCLNDGKPLAARRFSRLNRRVLFSKIQEDIS